MEYWVNTHRAKYCGFDEPNLPHPTRNIRLEWPTGPKYSFLRHRFYRVYISKETRRPINSSLSISNIIRIFHMWGKPSPSIMTKYAIRRRGQLNIKNVASSEDHPNCNPRNLRKFPQVSATFRKFRKLLATSHNFSQHLATSRNFSQLPPTSHTFSQLLAHFRNFWQVLRDLGNLMGHSETLQTSYEVI